MPEVSEKTAKNAAALDSFLERVKKDKIKGKVRTLMMPVRDGMLALTTPAKDVEEVGGVWAPFLFFFVSARVHGSFFVNFLFEPSWILWSNDILEEAQIRRGPNQMQVHTV